GVHSTCDGRSDLGTALAPLDSPSARCDPHALAVCRRTCLVALTERNARSPGRIPVPMVCTRPSTGLRNFLRRPGSLKNGGNALEGQPVKVTDFQEWQGATGVWDGEFVDGKLVPGTGYPVLIIRVKRDDSVFSAPTDVAVPSGFNLYYDDPARDIRIVVVYDRCAHLCCYPGWQVVQNPPPARDYLSPAPTYQVFGIDP